MTRVHRIGAKAWILAFFFVSTAAQAQEAPRLVDRVGDLFDEIGEGLNLIGQKASDLVGPGLGLDLDTPARYTEAREYSEQFLVGPSPTVVISNEFGEIRVSSWDNALVQVDAEVVVGAESGDVAGELARSTNISVDAAEDRVEVDTVLPDTRGQMGKVAITVNYAIVVPRDTNLICENYFGDTAIEGLDGAVALNSQYGMVRITDVGGRVTARSQGQFPFDVVDLAGGGTFELNGAVATFSGVDGPLRVSNFRGTVALADLGPDVQADISNEMGAITLSLPENATPDLEATCLFGQIRSDIELGRSRQGQLTVARSPHVESRQRIGLRSEFGDIFVKVAGRTGESVPALLEGTELFTETVRFEEALPDDVRLRIEAMEGDVRIEGADEDGVRVSATKLIRVRDRSNAQVALEALAVSFEERDGVWVLKSRARDDMAGLGCAGYSVALTVFCPRTALVDVQAKDGHTDVQGMGAALTVRQAAGAVTAEHSKAELDLVNDNGDVEVLQCAGPIKVKAAYGTVFADGIYGPVTTFCQNGKTVIQAVHDTLNVTQKGGDVRVIALEGVNGNYDVHVEQGDLSILLPTTAHVIFEVAAQNGSVKSAIQLNGTITSEVQEFHRKLNDGTYRVTLHTVDGDIQIN